MQNQTTDISLELQETYIKSTAIHKGNYTRISSVKLQLLPFDYPPSLLKFIRGLAAKSRDEHNYVVVEPKPPYSAANYPIVAG